MGVKWDADETALLLKRLGKSAHELGLTGGNASCPEIWELDNGDVAIIGTELTASYRDRLPSGVTIDPGEGLVVIPRKTIASAKADIPNPGLLDGATGERMELPAYYADFEKNFSRARQFWKLERGQVFAEPGDDSWEAFDRGDWDESMRLLEARRADLVRYHRENARTRTARIRIVSLPLTPYMQWELNLLRIRDETGGPVRVLLDSDVASLEDEGPLPEIYTMDDMVMYEAVYDGNGVLEAALRYTGPELVSRGRDFISGLYERGEPIGDFFRREVAHLPPARPGRPAIPRDYLAQTGRPGPIRS